jgi:hypothetical protein
VGREGHAFATHLSQLPRRHAGLIGDALVLVEARNQVGERPSEGRVRDRRTGATMARVRSGSSFPGTALG